MKNKILVISESKASLHNTLKKTINLAKYINGDIMLLSIQNPTDVVKADNQLSAIRELNYQYISKNNELHNLVENSKKKFKINIEYSFSIGQYKTEVKKFIASHQPDIIVISKRRQTFFNLVKSKSVDFVINNFSGHILITDDDTVVKENESLSLATFNCLIPNTEKSILKSLIDYSKTPVKSFKILNSETISKKKTVHSNHTEEFVFEHNDNAFNTLSSYLEKKGVNLLYLDGQNFRKEKRKELKKLINSVKVPMLLSMKTITETTNNYQIA